MKIIPLHAFTDNYIWVIPTPPKKSFFCVDPGDATPVLNYAKKNQLTRHAILLTHHHHDHVGGVKELSEAFPNVLIYRPEDSNKDLLCIDNYEFQIINTPGHTQTHRCYYEPHQQLLFCGDTLFSGGCGRVFDGTIEQLYASITLLATLPDATKVYCAHEYTRNNLAFAATVEPKNPAITDMLLQLNENPTACSLPSTIAKEKQINPFFHTEGALLHEFAISRRLDPSNAFSLFKRLREEKDQFRS